MLSNLTAAQKIHGAYLLGFIVCFCVTLLVIWEAQEEERAELEQPAAGYAAIVLERVKAATHDEHAGRPAEELGNAAAPVRPARRETARS